jgi:cell division protein FtsL
MSQTWFQHTFSRKRFQTRNQATAMAMLGIAILLIVGSLYLSQVASFAITNREIEDLISRRDQLKRQNEQLIGEIASFRTVPRLFARAVEIGFQPATNNDIDYLLIEGYNPPHKDGQADALPSKPLDGAAPAYEQTFSSWLEQQLTLLSQQLESFGK